MLKVFIADDDSIIRRGLKTMIEGNTGDFAVVGEAADGLTAQELISKLGVDLLITDIKMPVMDGVELVKSIYNSGAKVKVIVLSGYDEYGFVRETLKNGAVDYILKPVQKDNLMELLNRVKRIIENEKSLEVNRNIQEVKLKEASKALKESFLHRWIKGYYTDSATIEAKLSELGYHKLQSFLISIISLDDEVKHMAQTCNTALCFEQDFRQLIQEMNLFSESGLDIIYSIDKGEAIIIFLNLNVEEDYFKQWIDSCLVNLKEKTERGCKVSITAGCSKLERDPNRAHISYYQASLAAAHKFYIGKGKITWYNPQDCLYNQVELKQINDEVCTLLKFVELGDSVKVKKSVLEMLDKLGNNNLKPTEYKDTCISVFSKICNMFEEFRDVYILQKNYKNDIVDYVQKVDTLDELKEYFSDYLCNLTEQMNFMRQEKSSKIIEIAKSYILKHFNEEIGLKDIAEQVYLNPNYFSVLFKQETGKNFIDFLTEARINQAKNLLKKNDIKINEVGLMVGYNDPSTFLRAFKKIIGISPAEYKKIIK